MLTDKQVSVDLKRIALGAIPALVVGTVVLKQAWLSDDAMINVRTVLNLIHGNGPNFNVIERVQGYTSPAWLLLNSAVSVVTHESVLSHVLLGVVLSLVAVVVATLALDTTPARMGLIVLAFSWAFTTYGTSGLENALAYLAVAIAFWAIRRERPLLIAAALGLLVLTRHDYAVIALPVFVWLVLRYRSEPDRIMRWVKSTALFIGPLLLWSLFSVAYYGAALPNTFYAKLNVEIPRSEFIPYGINYLGDLLFHDPAGFVILATGIVLAVRGRGTTGVRVLGVSACVLYTGYVIWIGGGFMSGRFFAVGILAALLVTADFVDGLGPEAVPKPRVLVGAALAALAVISVAVGWPGPVLADPLAGEAWPRGPVVDERGLRVERGASLWSVADHSFRGGIAEARAAQGQWRRIDPVVPPEEVVVGCAGVGAGVLAGPELHIVVDCALTDALLARLPYDPGDEQWRQGHFVREIPAGYIESIQTGSNVIEDPEIADLYDRLLERIDRTTG